jgi:hypothetical protein
LPNSHPKAGKSAKQAHRRCGVHRMLSTTFFHGDDAQSSDESPEGRWDENGWTFESLIDTDGSQSDANQEDSKNYCCSSHQG